MSSTPDRQHAMALIEEAHRAGARWSRACAEGGIDVRPYPRWTAREALHVAGRPDAVRPEPANKRSGAERAPVLAVCQEPAYASLPPGPIVPRRAAEGRYLASESSFYRLRRAADEQHPRGRGRRRSRRDWGHVPPTQGGRGIVAGCRDRSRGGVFTST